MSQIIFSHFRPDSIRAKTAELRAAWGEIETDPTEDTRSEHHIRVQEAFDKGDWGCQKANVHRLAQALTGFELTIGNTVDDDEYPPFIPGALIVVDDETLFIRGCDDDGDALIYTVSGEDETAVHSYITNDDGDWRAATSEEVEAFLIASGLVAPTE